MRNTSLKGFNSSKGRTAPLKFIEKHKTSIIKPSIIAPTNRRKSYTGSESKYTQKGDTIGGKIAKAVTPENSVKGMLNTVLPVNKAIKAGKAVYNYFKQG